MGRGIGQVCRVTVPISSTKSRGDGHSFRDSLPRAISAAALVLQMHVPSVRYVCEMASSDVKRPPKRSVPALRTSHQRPIARAWATCSGTSTATIRTVAHLPWLSSLSSCAPSGGHFSVPSMMIGSPRPIQCQRSASQI